MAKTYDIDTIKDEFIFMADMIESCDICDYKEKCYSGDDCYAVILSGMLEDRLRGEF